MKKQFAALLLFLLIICACSFALAEQGHMIPGAGEYVCGGWIYGIYENENHHQYAGITGFYNGPSNAVIPLTILHADDQSYPVEYVHIDGSWTGTPTSISFAVDSSGRTPVNHFYITHAELITSLTVPEGVTSFLASDCPSLVTVHLPSTVTSLPTGAFWHDSSLKNVNLENIYAMDRWAFSDTALEEVVIRDGVTVLEGALFFDCPYLRSVQIPDSVTDIGNDAFGNCVSLTDVNLPEGLTNIRLRCFQNCSSLQEIHLPSTVKVLEDLCFDGCSSLSSINLPYGLTDISSLAFGGCDAVMPELTIPGTVNHPGSLPSHVIKLVVEEGVTSLAMHTLNYVEEVYLPSTLVSPGGFPNAIKATVYKVDQLFLHPSWMPGGEGGFPLQELTITCPDELGDFGYQAAYCNVRKVTMEDTITAIPEYAFSGWGKLAEINIPSQLTTIGREAFAGCESLKTVAIPQGVTCLDYVFMNSGVETVSLPEGLETMHCAFQNCASLRQVNIPSTVTDMQDAFQNCASLPAIIIPQGARKMYSAFQGCASLSSVTLENGVVFEDNYFSGAYMFKGCSSLRTIAIPQSVNLLCLDMFAQSGMEEITIPEQITSLPDRLFEDCASLHTVNLPRTLEYIGVYAFKNCAALKEIDIPDGAQLNAEAFDGDELTFILAEGTSAFDYARGRETISYRFRDPLQAVNGSKAAVTAQAVADSESGEGKLIIHAPEVKQKDEGVYYFYLVKEDNGAVRLNSFVQSQDTAEVIVDRYLERQPFTVYVGVARNSWAFGTRGSNDDVYTQEGYDILPLQEILWTSDGYITLDENGGAVVNGSTLHVHTLPDGLKTIEREAFAGIDGNGWTLICPAGLKTIQASAFASAGIRSVFLPASVTSIGSGAFSGSSLIVYCPAGSYAEGWAMNSGYTVVTVNAQAPN